MVSETEGLDVLNPVSQLAADLGDAQVMPNRLAALEGKRIGLYWNRKPGGIYFLNRVETRLKQEFASVEVFHFDSRRPIQKSVIDAIVDARCDLVVGATAD
jgi:hypothetical protein